MKKIYLSMMTLAMMVAALGFTACGGDDEDEIGGVPNKGQMSLKIDDEPFYATNCTAEQTRSNGM